MLLAAAVSLSLILSCGSKEEEQTMDEETVTEETEVTAEEAEFTEETEIEATEAQAGDTMTDEEFDKFCKDYEELLVKYSEYMEAAKNGNPEASQELATLMTKGQEMSDKYEAYADKLTPEQIAKFMTLAQKWAHAMGQPQQ